MGFEDFLKAHGLRSMGLFFFFLLFFLHHPTLFRWKRALRFASPPFNFSYCLQAYPTALGWSLIFDLGFVRRQSSCDGETPLQLLHLQPFKTCLSQSRVGCVPPLPSSPSHCVGWVCLMQNKRPMERSPWAFKHRTKHEPSFT